MLIARVRVAEVLSENSRMGAHKTAFSRIARIPGFHLGPASPCTCTETSPKRSCFNSWCRPDSICIWCSSDQHTSPYKHNIEASRCLPVQNRADLDRQVFL